MEGLLLFFRVEKVGVDWVVCFVGVYFLSLFIVAVLPVSPIFLRPALRLYDCVNAAAWVSGME